VYVTSEQRVVPRLADVASHETGDILGPVHRTSQRRAILQVLEEAPGPLTPQEVLERAAAYHSGLGLATVYRNLNAMVARGQASEVHLPNESTRFEKSRGDHHHHFSCDSCGQVYEFDANCPVAVLEGATLPGGFQVRDHSLTLYGSCPSCSAGA